MFIIIQTFNLYNLWQSYRALKTKIFLKENVLPSICREERQFLVEVGIEYKKIHSCKNDFILYRCEYKDNVKFHECKEKRYCTYVQGLIAPKKALCHMPIIPRLQRMFRCKSLAQLMGCHAKNRNKDGFMKILANSKALKHIKEKWPTKFKDETRSIRFGLAIDGLFPFSFMSSYESYVDSYYSRKTSS